jgi:serine/threonine-protein kinase
MEHEERLKAALADRYQIEREIGSGGIATVYLARDLKHDCKVAVKVLDSPNRLLPDSLLFFPEERTWGSWSTQW